MMAVWGSAMFWSHLFVLFAQRKQIIREIHWKGGYTDYEISCFFNTGL